METTGRDTLAGAVCPQDVEVPFSGPVHDPVTADRVPHVPPSAGEFGGPPGFADLPRPLRASVGIAAALCMAVALVHVVMVFLYVAPPNEVSQRYRKQINAWIHPLFEQNWRLFAPDPQSVTQQISARTLHTSPEGSREVSDWFDLTAVDDAAINHNAFPSHTSQNMLRRAWDAYAASHGNDDQSKSERALMLQKYLRNIAVNRVSADRHNAFEDIQLRVITRPIAAGTSAGRRPNTPAQTRYLPWWKVASDGN
ncbi:DUF5819 family protein [Streptomyces sp. SP17BM10]|uniref:DUF5819 family protein n=1 Tax=Streptomyces sp. SP17BM10 TaxID=3002530 RepID=UPI002E7A15FB|nr:DUF5819 family protein [Streptomyces sp. SP17BM10]MEE1783988.1 DUF5819 family protein [Streptomyces sp. SP17BM10]